MKLVISAAFLLLLIGSALSTANAQGPVRIRFKKRAESSTVRGTLSGYKDSRAFLIRVRPGQTLRTEQVGDNEITVYVTDPTGENVGDSDASCNNRREIRPTIAGDYKLIVVECQKADDWRGSFRFRVSVS